MADTPKGGMFSKLINPDTAKPQMADKPTPRTVHQPVNMVQAARQSPPAAPQSPAGVNGSATTGTTRRAKRKQISAYLSREQLHLLKQLHYRLNTDDVVIEKSEIIGLGVEILARFLGTYVPKYSSIEQLREYLNTQVSKCLDTQPPQYPTI